MFVKRRRWCGEGKKEGEEEGEKEKMEKNRIKKNKTYKNQKEGEKGEEEEKKNEKKQRPSICLSSTISFPFETPTRIHISFPDCVLCYSGYAN